MHEQFRIEVHNGIETHHVTLFGDLDLAEAGRLCESLVDIAGSTVVVDLSGLTFIDAAGVGAILEAKAKVERDGHAFRIGATCEMVQKVFEVCGLQDLIEDVPNSPHERAQDTPS
jgi:anti-anti-sigma factor